MKPCSTQTYFHLFNSVTMYQPYTSIEVAICPLRAETLLSTTDTSRGGLLSLIPFH